MEHTKPDYPSVAHIKYHIIWVTRRRRKVLDGEVADRLQALLSEKAQDLDLGIEYLAIHPEHVYLYVSAPPSLAVSQIVYRLKDYTASILRREIPDLRKMPSMWTRSYFCSTVGQVFQRTIRNYIESQSTRA